MMPVPLDLGYMTTLTCMDAAGPALEKAVPGSWAPVHARQHVSQRGSPGMDGQGDAASMQASMQRTSGQRMDADQFRATTPTWPYLALMASVMVWSL